MNLTNSELLDRYEAMQRLSLHMLEAAQKNDWDRLIKLEQSRAECEKELRDGDKSAWAGTQAAQKTELIRSILDADNQTRRLTQVWMGEMQKSLGSISAGEKLKQAYRQA
jgi:flagellar protein FliT